MLKNCQSGEISLILYYLAKSDQIDLKCLKYLHQDLSQKVTDNSKVDFTES